MSSRYHGEAFGGSAFMMMSCTAAFGPQWTPLLLRRSQSRQMVRTASAFASRSKAGFSSATEKTPSGLTNPAGYLLDGAENGQPGARRGPGDVLAHPYMAPDTHGALARRCRRHGYFAALPALRMTRSPA